MKLSGLDVDHEYEFHLVMKTTAGQYESNRVTVRTHKMEDLSGIVVVFGEFNEPEPVVSDMKQLLDKVGATWQEDITSDTTHLIAEVPRGPKYEKALTSSIPAVKPDWLVQCEKNQKIQACTFSLCVIRCSHTCILLACFAILHCQCSYIIIWKSIGSI